VNNIRTLLARQAEENREEEEHDDEQA